MQCSIVILNWNRPEDTVLAVKSVLKSEPTDNYDIVVWDNASEDNSVEQISQAFRNISNVRLITSESNFGVAGGRNRAFEACSGDIVIFLDNDIVVETPNSLSMITKVFEDHQHVGAISFEIIRPDGHLMWPFTRPATTWRQCSFETIRIDGGASAIRRDAFKKAGKFAEHFSPYGAEDAHFSYRLLAAGYQLRYEPSIRVIHAFSIAGRSPLQFSYHVRNSLWIPMENFPQPYASISTTRKALELLQDAIRFKLMKAYVKGILMAFASFKHCRRKPLGKNEWKYLRRLIKEDKQQRSKSAEKTA